MASYYSRRPIFANTIPGHQRLYPRNRDVEQAQQPGLGDLPLRQSDTSYANTSPVAPPPAYVGAGIPLPLSRTVSSGATLVSHGSGAGHARRSRVVKVGWSYHPALAGPRLWLNRLPRLLRRDKEVLDLDFPAEFNELLASAGQGGEEHDGGLKIRELWQARVSHLNTWVIPERLVASRFWTALMEIIDLLIVILFIVALAVTRGRQTGILQGAEVALILVILVNAGLVNQIRIRRWQLRQTLRNISRDWSPLPTTSSTAVDLVNAYIGQGTRRPSEDVERDAAHLRQQQADEAQRPVMRWSMYTHEGGFWAAWRPVVQVELIVPSIQQSDSSPRGDHRSEPLGPGYTGESQASAAAEDWVPTYSARQSAGERVVQFAPRSEERSD